ncbi:FAD-dependent monooxygenase [Streptomyces sp. NPDC101455]|uniref:FAD-dependent monooxygenase n=1 Tax=Streptomyces sp. NPDC101455 TaxID=3366142 RepID=UPI0038172393
MEDLQETSVLVVGGGIGGLATAIALRKAGAGVEVAEINDDWSVAGWGLALTGPALRALDSLGLADTLIERGYGLNQLFNRDSSGEVVNTQDFPSLLGRGRPAQAGMSRPVLAQVLLEAAETAGVTLRNSLTLASFTEGPDSIAATMSDGTTRTVDLIVGADGVFSKVRTALGVTEEPVYTGQMIWRAIVPRPEWSTGISTFSGGTNNAGLIPLSDTQAYCFLTENTDNTSFLSNEELADRMRELLAPFSGKVAEVRETITDPSTVIRRPAHTLFVKPPWHKGRVVLLGDAVHSPSPQLTSGTAMAVEDALVLVEELGRANSVVEALDAYGKRRARRCAPVVSMAYEISQLERTGRYHETYPLHGKAHAAMAEVI